MPEENSIFMKTSSRALGILTQLHSETAQAMYAYTVGRQLSGRPGHVAA